MHGKGRGRRENWKEGGDGERRRGRRERVIERVGGGGGRENERER